MSEVRPDTRRVQIEHEVNLAYKERLDRLCYNERVSQQRMYRWGQTEKAKAMPLSACKEIGERFGNQYAYQTTMYGF